MYPKWFRRLQWKLRKDFPLSIRITNIEKAEYGQSIFFKCFLGGCIIGQYKSTLHLLPNPLYWWPNSCGYQFWLITIPLPFVHLLDDSKLPTTQTV